MCSSRLSVLCLFLLQFYATEMATEAVDNAMQAWGAMGMTKADRNEMIRSMVERLATKMKKNPNDKIGWLRLERAYRVMGETTLANEAAAQAAKLP